MLSSSSCQYLIHSIFARRHLMMGMNKISSFMCCAYFLMISRFHEFFIFLRLFSSQTPQECDMVIASVVHTQERGDACHEGAGGEKGGMIKNVIRKYKIV